MNKHHANAQEPTKADLLQYEASKMQIEAPQRLSTAIIQLPTGDSVVEAMVDLQVEPPAVISWDQVTTQARAQLAFVVVSVLLTFFTNNQLKDMNCFDAPSQHVAACKMVPCAYVDRWHSANGHLG